MIDEGGAIGEINVTSNILCIEPPEVKASIWVHNILRSLALGARLRIYSLPSSLAIIHLIRISVVYCFCLKLKTFN